MSTLSGPSDMKQNLADQTKPVSCSNDCTTTESYTYTILRKESEREREQRAESAREQFWQRILLLLTKSQLRCGQKEFRGCQTVTLKVLN